VSGKILIVGSGSVGRKMSAFFPDCKNLIEFETMHDRELDFKMPIIGQAGMEAPLPSVSLWDYSRRSWRFRSTDVPAAYRAARRKRNKQSKKNRKLNRRK
jgi:hypothetical protein